VTHWIVPSVECSLTTSVWSARVTIVESRIAAIPPTISASTAFRTSGVSPAALSARSTVVLITAVSGLLY
jgi:hypothetical protein